MRFIIVTTENNSQTLLPLSSIYCVCEYNVENAKSAIRTTPYDQESFLLALKDTFDEVVDNIKEASK